MNEYTNSEIGHAENKTVLSSLGINGMQLVIQFVNLTIVLLVVWYLILKPLTKKMDERKKLIDESLEKAQKIETEFQMSQQKIQAKIDAAKMEAKAIIEKAYADQIEQTKEMKEKTKVELATAVAEAKAEIKKEKLAMEKEINDRMAELVTDALAKIIGNEKNDVNKILIEKVVKELK